MAFGTTYANDIQKLVFQATPNIANLLDNASSSPLTNLYISLHTADPSAGNQQTSEANYTGYLRVTVARTSAGFTVSTNSVSNTAAVTFPKCTGGSSTVTYAAIGTTDTGNAGMILASGQLGSSLAVTTNVQPQFAVGALSFAIT